jgi:hypothetical protein
MEKPNIINFSEFFKNTDTKTPFNKEDFKDFFIEEEVSAPIIEEIQEPIIEEIAAPKVKQKVIEPIVEEVVIEEEIEEVEEVIEESENYYMVYKDKSENFEVEISVEGANLNETEARLILESDEWTLMFVGEIDKKGKCVIPLKKLGILTEGITGKIKLEVIADNTIFTPWEDEFKVKLSKKVTIKMNESRVVPKKPLVLTPGVKVNVKR